MWSESMKVNLKAKMWANSLVEKKEVRKVGRKVDSMEGSMAGSWVERSVLLWAEPTAHWTVDSWAESSVLL